ncbi:MAG: nucleotide exchange factor GrpE [Candidatus Diapherotrites archaeon]|nr:nucleotide exchange factor GrpE [Candidatus Diapherotrites archaeon]
MSSHKPKDERGSNAAGVNGEPAKGHGSADFAKLKGLEQKLEKSEADAAEFKADLQRLQADFENFRKRCEREKIETALHANAGLLQDFLPLLDSLNAALSAKQLSTEEKKGIALVKGQFEEILKKEGVSEIPAQGKHFDSGVHECLLRESVPAKADGIVLEELQKGYLFRNRVLRHAKVKVNVLENAEDDAVDNADEGAGPRSAESEVVGGKSCKGDDVKGRVGGKSV